MWLTSKRTSNPKKDKAYTDANTANATHLKSLQFLCDFRCFEKMLPPTRQGHWYGQYRRVSALESCRNMAQTPYILLAYMNLFFT
jgi:hypothetical protein